MPDGDASTTDATTTTDTTTDSGGAGKTFTQEQVNDLIAREKGKIQGKYQGFDELKAKAAKLDELKASQMSDVEKLTGERDTLRGELEPTKAENLRLRVALDKKLPTELIDRLKGSTKEELEADADQLLQLVGSPRGGHDGGPRGRSAAPASDMDAFLRKAAGR
jgi:hypothetical protein